MEIARSIRCIQVDAVAAPGLTTQYLVPLSRLGPYDPAELDRLQWEARRLYWWFAHAASLVLTEDFPIHRLRKRAYASRSDPWGQRIASWIEDNRALRDHVVDEITRRGPLRSRDFENAARTDWRSSGWTEGRSVNRMLEFLWLEGVLMVVGKAGQERLWDLSERWLPEWTPAEVLSPEEVSDRSVAFALKALGPATPSQVYFTFTRGFYPDLKGSIRRLVAAGEVLPVTLKELRGEWFLHRDSLPLLEARWEPRTVLLSPFDNLIAARKRTLQLFGFDYSIEIYVPAAKRKRGYYAMPILAGDRLVGSVDPSFDRKTGVLSVNRVALEDGARFTDAARRAVSDLAALVGASEVSYR